MVQVWVPCRSKDLIVTTIFWPGSGGPPPNWPCVRLTRQVAFAPLRSDMGPLNTLMKAKPLVTVNSSAAFDGSQPAEGSPAKEACAEYVPGRTVRWMPHSAAPPE